MTTSDKLKALPLPSQANYVAQVLMELRPKLNRKEHEKIAAALECCDRIYAHLRGNGDFRGFI